MNEIKQQRDDIAKILVTEEEIQQKVAELGAKITQDYRGKNLLMVSVLKGSVIFMADLMRAIDLPCTIDFMCVSSYGSGTSSSGVVKIIKDLDIDLHNKDLLIVEDILDRPSTISPRCSPTGAPPPSASPPFWTSRSAGWPL